MPESRNFLNIDNASSFSTAFDCALVNPSLSTMIATYPSGEFMTAANSSSPTG